MFPCINNKWITSLKIGMLIMQTTVKNWFKILGLSFQQGQDKILKAK